MAKVIGTATVIAVTCYALAGYFGYATFALSPSVDTIMQKVNILEAPYDNNGWILAA